MILIKGARPYNEDPVDILIDGDRITEVGPSIDRDDAEVIDASGLIALPGLVDLHTHLRQPGLDDAETVLSGSRAAALGGFTCIHAMANTDPTQDNAGVVDQVFHLGLEAGLTEVRVIGAVSQGLKGEKLAELGAMHDSEAQVGIFSDDGQCVGDPVLMRRALEYVKSFDGLIAQHAQDPGLTEGAQMHEGCVSARLGLGGWPAVAEESIIARDCLLAQHVDSRLHVLHASTKGSVELIRWAKEQGIRVTAEVTPHHLSLDHSEAESYDPIFKVNPPLRTREDVEALRRGLADGTIDTVGTDHAPHPLESKDCEWAAGAFGMTGLETALSVIQDTMVKTGLMDWRGVARVMSENPAKIAGLTDQGQPIGVGAPAHLILFDPSVNRIVDPESHASKSTNSPWRGRELPGQVVATFYAGQQVVANSKIVERA